MWSYNRVNTLRKVQHVTVFGSYMKGGCSTEAEPPAPKPSPRARNFISAVRCRTAIVGASPMRYWGAIYAANPPSSGA